MTGTSENPGTVLLGRFDATGQLRYMGRGSPYDWEPSGKGQGSAGTTTG